jgi:2-polyprenyl-6-methoxyphenol hydroxylase-like FAD-dependent oxidoreductase
MGLKNQRILVSGASIAGPTLAYWLARRGFRPTVVERASGPREGGSPIDVRGPAVDVVDRMGIRPQLSEADLDTAGLSFVNAAGAQVSSLNLRAIRTATGGTEYELPRAGLVRILHGASSDDVEYVFNDSITALHQDGDGVDVEFQRGEARRFDLVIGADGLHSAVRRLAFGDESQFVRYLGYHAAVIRADRELGRDRWGVVHNVPGKMVCVYSPPGRTDALFLFRQPERLRYDHRDPEQQKRLVAEAFAGESWQVPRLLELLMAADDLYFDSVSQVRLPRWSRGRVTLVGDAAHGLPLFGDGSSRAMIGAYLLAGELAAADGDHEAAFGRYEGKQRPGVEAVHAGLRTGIAMLVPDTGRGIWRRNQLSRLSNLAPALGRLSRWNKRLQLTLPDYERRTPAHTGS